MSNTVEFILKLKDLMSGSMQRVAATTQSSFNTVNRVVNGATRNISDMNRRLDDLRKTRELSVDMSQIRSANREIERLENRIERMTNYGRRGNGSGGGMGLGGMFAGIGLGNIVGIGSVYAVGRGVGSSISSAMEGQKIKASMQVLAGQGKGGDLYKDITKFAQESIFGNELYKDAQTLMGFGIKSDNVMPYLRMLGDISMGDKEKLGSLTLAFSQMRAAGKLMGQDLNQMIQSGFNPMGVMAQKTGKSMAELRSLMEKGAITSDMVTNAFVAATSKGGMFYDMTNNIARTDFGKWENFKGTVQGIALQLGSVLLPVVSKVIDFFSKLASYAPAIIQSVQPFFDMLASAGSQDFLSKHITALQLIGAAVLPIFKELKPLLSTVLSTVFELGSKISSHLAPAFKKVAPVLQDVAHILSTVLSPAIRIVGWALGKLVDIAGWLVDKITAIIKPIVKLISWVADGVGSVLGMTANVIDPKKAKTASILKSVTQPTPTTTPGLTGNTSPSGSPSADFSALNETSSKINGGGVRNITINLGKMFDDIVIHTQTINEGIDHLEDKVKEALMRVLNSGNALPQ
jgi:tape measure domain-containing protein